LKHLPSSHSLSTYCQRGFTLVELVVTIALLAILTMLAIPSFSEVLRQWRRDSATRELSTSLQIARSEAVKTSRQTVICPSVDQTACTASNEWNTGWIVFVDDGAGTQTNANNQVLDTNERPLKVVSAQAGVATLTSTVGVQWLRFLPNGLMRTGDAANNITFIVTPSGATAATKVDTITVTPVGRVSVATELP
jgi:type IV fimbrial biogenesis protein FimT